MKTTSHGWKVVDESRGVLCFEYSFRPGSTANAMSVRLNDGTLALISPPCRVDDGVIRDLEPFGRVSVLIANNSWHHLGLPEWRRAVPGASVHAARGAIPRLQKQQPTLETIDPIDRLAHRLPSDTQMSEAPGTRTGDVWLKAGPTWFVSDCFFNMATLPPGIAGMLFKLTHTAPGLSISGAYKALFVKDKPGFKRWMLSEIDAGSPTVLVPSHGQLEGSPSLGAQMRKLAESRL